MKRLALSLLIVALERVFPSQPPDHILAERQRAQAWERQKCLSWAAKIRAEERAMQHGLDDWWHFENDYEWDEVSS